MSRIGEPPIPAQGQPVRKTEDTDTRQAIHRHDPEFYRKKRDDSEQPGFKDPYEDLADVSVPALKNFLMGLLDRMPHEAGSAAPSSTAAPVEAPRPPVSPQAAAAMQAYQSGARRTAAAPPPPMPVAPPPPPASGANALDEAAAGLDRAAVLDLIRELDRLYAAGITAVSLEKGEGFLQSIRTAIDKAKAAGTPA